MAKAAKTAIKTKDQKAAQAAQAQQPAQNAENEIFPDAPEGRTDQDVFEYLSH